MFFQMSDCTFRGFRVSAAAVIVLVAVVAVSVFVIFTVEFRFLRSPLLLWQWSYVFRATVVDAIVMCFSVNCC